MLRALLICVLQRPLSPARLFPVQNCVPCRVCPIYLRHRRSKRLKLQQDYGQYKCSAGQEHMACDVDKTMEMRAVTNSKVSLLSKKGGECGCVCGNWK